MKLFTYHEIMVEMGKAEDMEQVPESVGCEDCGFALCSSDVAHQLEEYFHSGRGGGPIYVERCTCREDKNKKLIEDLWHIYHHEKESKTWNASMSDKIKGYGPLELTYQPSHATSIEEVEEFVIEIEKTIHETHLFERR